ncbi:hypothetical protein DYBT9623_05437 [Dyadobacter sp. CECT 9623]|uniref:DUF389 domain-containing protein n=1 Tax=Dyadobacter linearis TaxID=2823330 RepID=A0ABM8UYJ3_9BACT|nr:hypothetical protein DYBT9623_05437 [Dyadobacter sp. CECT 9623]
MQKSGTNLIGKLNSMWQPNIYDVIIALVGGLAGIVAISSKNKGNVIPGVAIATALMPPLCTAGFGLATTFGNTFSRNMKAARSEACLYGTGNLQIRIVLVKKLAQKRFFLFVRVLMPVVRAVLIISVLLII